MQAEEVNNPYVEVVAVKEGNKVDECGGRGKKSTVGGDKGKKVGEGCDKGKKVVEGGGKGKKSIVGKKASGGRGEEK